MPRTSESKRFWRGLSGWEPKVDLRTGVSRTIEFFRDSVFNYPSFAEAYKVAALNGLNKL